MNDLRKCLNCKALYAVDVRNKGRQQYCSAKNCQRARKSINQRKRRIKDKCQEAQLKPAEADYVAAWMSQNVVLVGLIAKLTAVDDP